MQTETQERDVVWARVDDGFYVGSRPGHFLGCIDRDDDGRFVALDTHTQPIGTFAHLADAMEAVAAAYVSGTQETATPVGDA
ncbi:hypothetical protein MIC448_1990001 [Microbacterium sp. C448]|uniref:hypothetical protein n=1 Tax=Microbacterium TaxID=33882 RepID=UPI0003DE1027|nr:MULTISPECIES: hypothetical protein [Microbacterium]CDJ99958.1 hypothetical protein MIC448_1990001 [Microbacterium sp. C448]